MDTTLVRQGNISVAFTPDQVQLIKNTVANGATDNELAMFIHWCQGSGFDPLRRQAHFSIRPQKCQNCKGSGKVASGTCPMCELGYIRVPVFIAGIDGILSRAQEFQNYNGYNAHAVRENDDFQFDGIHNEPVTHLFGSKERGKLVGAYCVVYFKDGRHPVSHWYPAVEYAAVAGYVAQQMPESQLVKAAISIAHRRAYPEPFSGVYSPEEFGGHTTDTGEVIIPPPTKQKSEPPKPMASIESETPSAEEFIEGVLVYKLDYRRDKDGKPFKDTKTHVVLDKVKQVRIALPDRPVFWRVASEQVKLPAEGVKLFEGLFRDKAEMREHLKTYYSKNGDAAPSEIASLTWEELMAVYSAKHDDIYDPRWYPEPADPKLISELAEAYACDNVAFLEQVAKLPDPRCLLVVTGKYSVSVYDRQADFTDLARLMAEGKLTFDSEVFWNTCNDAFGPPASD